MPSKPATRSRKPHLIVAAALDDAKATDITVLDMSEVTDFTDYMVIATGASSRQVQSAADRVAERMRESGLRVHGREGHGGGDWILLDFGSVVVHVMRQEIRDFYNLEKFWADAKRVRVTRTVKRAVRKKTA